MAAGICVWQFSAAADILMITTYDSRPRPMITNLSFGMAAGVFDFEIPKRWFLVLALFFFFFFGMDRLDRLPLVPFR